MEVCAGSLLSSVEVFTSESYIIFEELKNVEQQVGMS